MSLIISSWYGEVKVTSRYSFALTSRSLKDFIFLYEIRGGSFNISRSNGWFQDVCEVWQRRVVGCEVLFRTFSFGCKADFRSQKLFVHEIVG